MYMFDEMVSLALEDGDEWKSEKHRAIAVNTLIQNPRVFTREKMLRNGKIINSLTDDEAKTIDLKGLLDKGCDFI